MISQGAAKWACSAQQMMLCAVKILHSISLSHVILVHYMLGTLKYYEHWQNLDSYIIAYFRKQFTYSSSWSNSNHFLIILLIKSYWTRHYQSILHDIDCHMMIEGPNRKLSLFYDHILLIVKFFLTHFLNKATTKNDVSLFG